ncbi:hypothetical protein DFH29DRAFT_871644 [Suillus ampliporus]|nr:hypothetical protein DFH29DRAFT_871644 [Suillus ampliporus]
MAHTMLCDTELPNKYWGDAILFSAHILNQAPTRAITGDLTLYEAFTGNKPSVSHIQAFGCMAHVHIPDEKCQKLGVKSLECIHLGLVPEQTAATHENGQMAPDPQVHIKEVRDDDTPEPNVQSKYAPEPDSLDNAVKEVLEDAEAAEKDETHKEAYKAVTACDNKPKILLMKP